jgi:hypothetical protein
MKVCLLVSLLLLSFSIFAADPVYYACINTGNGNMRLVDVDTACRPNESRISWNSTGPAGPAGPPGPQGPAGEDGTNAASGPPYIWACGPLNYGNAASVNALLHVFNGTSSTANVAVNFLNKNGVNLVGVTVPGSAPASAFPGQTGAATVPVAASNTLVMPWVTASGGSSADGGNFPATLRVTADQPVVVGTHIFFTGLTVVPCAQVHP